MDDAELQAIRAARLQEMQKNADSGSNNNSSNSGVSVNESVVNQMLDIDAKERLNRVRLVKPDRVAAVEKYILQLATAGGLRGKLSEDDLVDLLDRVARDERRHTATTITFARREYATNAGGGDSNSNDARKSNGDGSDDDDDDFFD